MKQYSFLIEAKEPFSLDKFKAFTNIHDRIKYCNNTLEFLGHGVGKRVYKLDDKRVLKVAYNKGGYSQNECEIKLGKYKFPFLCYIYDFDDKKYTWLISELCYIVAKDGNDGNFINHVKKITGYHPEIIYFLGFTCILGGLDLYKKIKDDLLKVCYKIIEIRNRSENVNLKNKVVAQKACMMCDISESSKKIIMQRFYGTTFIVARWIKKKYPIDINYAFNIIDSGKYKRVHFINEMVKTKNLSKVLCVDDCFNYSNTGIVNRNSKDYLVILDYGWSREMDKGK